MTDYFASSSAVLQQAGTQSMAADWKGATSQKFKGSRMHVPEPVFKEQPHPLFSTNGRRHFDDKLSDAYEWKPSIRVDPAKDQPKPERPLGTKKLDPKFSETKERHERRHIEAQPSGTYEDLEVGRKTYVMHNRKSVKEYSQEACMGFKVRIDTMYDQRNGVPLKSLGDKIYKTPQYMPGFYKEGGLIAGSTHQKKMKSSGNPKAIDFYSGLQLDKGPLNPNRKLWTDAVKEEVLNEELSAVNSLKNWERQILKEVDPKYQVDDDSD